MEPQLKKAIKNPEICPHPDQDCPVISELQWLRKKCKKLQKLTQTDPLTGLYNLRYLLKNLEDEMERTRRTAMPTSLLMIDLDHFKQINDSCGHESGNRILQWMSKFFHKHMRNIDKICRYGGEEFAIILPGTRLAPASHAAERLRAGLSNSRLKIDGAPLRLTASFGVDTYRGRRKITVKDFIKRTDNFLLQAKSSGRNRVCYQGIDTSGAPTQITNDEREALFAASNLKTG